MLKILISHLKQLLKPYKHLLKDDSQTLASACFCYYGACFLAICEHGCIKELDAILDFTLLYLLSDRYLDDITINVKKKYDFVLAMDALIAGQNLDENKANDETLTMIKTLYLRLSKSKGCKEAIDAIYLAQKKSYYIQSNKSYDGKIYRDICYLKGGLTVQALQCIIGTKPNNDGFKVGSLIQIVDDIIDIVRDKEDNVYTYARYRFDKDGSLDNLVKEVFDEIMAIDRGYNLFKIPLYLLLLYSTVEEGYFKLKYERPEMLKHKLDLDALFS